MVTSSCRSFETGRKDPGEYVREVLVGLGLGGSIGKETHGLYGFAYSRKESVT